MTLTPRQKQLSLQLFAIAPLAILGAAWAFSPEFRGMFEDGLDALLAQDPEALEAWGRERGIWAPAATSVLMIAQAIAAPIPAVVVTWTNSLLFGWVWGGVLSILSANLAASICYVIGRAWGEPVARRLIPKRAWSRSERFLHENGGGAIIAARLLPIVPFDPISYLAGIGGMRFRTFFWATLVGQIPAGMAYSWLGSRLTQPREFVVAGLCVLFGLFVIGWVGRKFVLTRRESGESTADEPPQAG